MLNTHGVPDFNLSILTKDQARARFDGLWDAGPSLSAYFCNEYVVFVDNHINDKDISNMMKTDFVHITFSRFPGVNGSINTFDLLMDIVFKNAAILESNDRVQMAVIMSKEKQYENQPPHPSSHC